MQMQTALRAEKYLEIKNTWNLNTNVLHQTKTVRSPVRVKERDRGKPFGSAPPTPPCVRVRTRRVDRVKPAQARRFGGDQESRTHDFVGRVEPPGVRTCAR